jgi:hypothetical protein
MNMFLIRRDVEMRKFFEQPPECASPFLEVPDFLKQPPECASPLLWIVGILKNTVITLRVSLFTMEVYCTQCSIHNS